MVLVKDLLTIEVIDRKSGEVIEKETTERSLSDGGSQVLLYFIVGYFADANVAKNWKYVYLFDSNKNRIKVLEGTWGTPVSTTNYSYCVLTATDDSTDSYTTAYQGLYHRADATLLGQMNVWQQQSKTKASDQVLRITWEIRIPFTPTP
ncbi:MAG: hypothetical protein QXY09_05960 [Acidilobaceae archaeon]